MISSRILKKSRFRNPVLIASLPDMGDVGGIAPRYIIEKLGATKFAEVTVLEKPWVEYQEGVVKVPKPVYSVYCHAPSHLIIFTGEAQPESPPTLFELCGSVLDIAGSVGALRRVVTIGGAESSNQKVERGLLSTVRAVTTNPRLIPEIKSHKVPLLDEREGAITWFNGVILAVCAERGIDGIGLYGAVEDPKVPQPLAVRNVLGLLITMGVIPEIDLAGLEEEHRRLTRLGPATFET
jgi:uncharacterized protein